MNKLLTTTAVALLLSVGPALAAEDAYESDQSGTLPEASQSDDSSLLPSDPEMKSEEDEQGQPQAAMEDEDGQPPTTSNVTPESAEEAKVPAEGSADESGGAKERSSAPPESGAVLGADEGAASDIPADEDSSGAAAGDQPQSDDSETSKE